MSVLLQYVPLGLLGLLLWVLIRRRAYQLSPCFFTYAVFGVAAGAARFAVHNHRDAYYLTYWITEAGYDLLGILVMYEVFRTVLGKLFRDWRAPAIFLTILAASFGLSLARAHDVPSQLGGILFYIVLGETAVRFVQVFVFSGLVTLVRVLGLRWRQYSFGVATGFGLYATVMLLTTVKFSDFGTKFKLLWGWTSVVAYSLTVVIWIWFFSAPQKTETSVVELPSPNDLTRYRDALRRMR